MKFLRNSLWFYKGLKEYTKSGFENASKKFNPADLEVNCNGQSFMITGANSGLGKQVMYMIYIYIRCGQAVRYFEKEAKFRYNC